MSDITYVWTYEGFVYLTSVMDLYSRKIISWTLSCDLTVSAVVSCVTKAIKRRTFDSPLVIHSDRGVQYISDEYKKLFNEKMKRSYSKKGDPWDNAFIESFHALSKREWLKRFKKLRPFLPTHIRVYRNVLQHRLNPQWLKLFDSK